MRVAFMPSMGIFESLQPIFYAERRIWEILSENNLNYAVFSTGLAIDFFEHGFVQGFYNFDKVVGRFIDYKPL